MTAKSLRHKFISAIADGADATLVRPQANWNDEHNLWLGGRSVTGTTDTLADSDHLSLVKYTNAGSIAVTLPQAGASSQFIAGWTAFIRNVGTGDVTITPTTSTINAASTLLLHAGQGALLFSDGTNYDAIINAVKASTAEVLAGTDDSKFVTPVNAALLPVVATSVKSAAYNLVAADRNASFSVSGSWTFGHTVTAASAGAGFRYTIKNTGLATITIDPAGSETIDGATTLKCLAKQAFTVVCDGANWYTIGRSNVVMITQALASAVATVDMTLPPDYTMFDIEYQHSHSAVIQLNMLLAFDGVPNFITTGNYYYQTLYSNASTSTAGAFTAQVVAFLSRSLAAGTAGLGRLLLWPTTYCTWINQNSVVFDAGGSRYIEHSAGWINTGSPRATNIRFYPGSGNISGTFTIFGHGA